MAKERKLDPQVGKMAGKLASHPEIDNPYALAQWMANQGFNISGEALVDKTGKPADLKKLITAFKAKRPRPKAKEAASASAFAALTRPKVKRPDLQSQAYASEQAYKNFVPIYEAATMDASKREIRCVVLTEGPGNLVTKNYYGPEAIEDAARKINEGKCFINHIDKLSAQLRPVGDIRDLSGFWKDGTVLENYFIKDLGRKGKACEATLVLDQSDAGSEALAKVQAQMLFRKSFPASAEVYAGISIKGQTLEDETKVVPGFEDWHYCVEFADGLGADIVTQPARGGEFLAIEQAVTEGRAWPDGKITKEEVRVIMKATELKKVVTQLNAAEAQLKTTKDGGIIKKLRATIKALEAKLQLHVRENKNEGEDKDSKDGLDMEAEGMEAIKALIPQHEDEEDEAYKARLAKAIKAVKASKAGEPCPEGEATPAMPTASQPEDGEDPEDGDGDGDGAPAAGATHIHIHGKESKESRELAELRAFKKDKEREERIVKMKTKALRLITEAGIPAAFLTPEDLVKDGTDENAWKRTIARTKAAMEGGTSYAFAITEEKDQASGSETQESQGNLFSSFKNAGVPVKKS